MMQHIHSVYLNTIVVAAKQLGQIFLQVFVSNLDFATSCIWFSGIGIYFGSGLFMRSAEASIVSLGVKI